MPNTNTDMANKIKWADHYSRRAKEDKWLARSVYKLEEIDKKYNLLHKRPLILDLGCYPGSWSQYCIKTIGKKGGVIGIDLKRPDQLYSPIFKFLEADILTSNIEWLADQIGQRDLVLSDMAPKTTGVSVADTSRSMELAQKAFEIALTVLKKDGHFLCKVFEGEELRLFRKRFSDYFRYVRLIRPRAIRKRSREIYVLGQEFKK